MRYAFATGLVLLFCSGCVMSMGERSPNLIAEFEGGGPQLDGMPPGIKVVFDHKHQMEGDRRKGMIEGASGNEFRKAYARVSKANPLLAQASLDPYYDVNYVLFLDTVVNEHGELAAFVSGFTLLILPASTSSDVVVTGTLYEAKSGQLVGIYEAKAELKMFIWLPLVVVTPITLATAPGSKELYDDTFRDLFAQMALALEDKTTPPAVPASSIVIEEQPAHIQRTIRSIRTE